MYLTVQTSSLLLSRGRSYSRSRQRLRSGSDQAARHLDIVLCDDVKTSSSDKAVITSNSVVADIPGHPVRIVLVFQFYDSTVLR